MLEVIAVVGTIVVVAGFALFVGLAPEREPLAARETEQRPGVAPSKFFGRRTAAAAVIESGPLSDEVLLRQLESHIRLEQAAVASFLQLPSGESLRRRSTSPLVN